VTQLLPRWLDRELMLTEQARVYELADRDDELGD